MNTHIPNEQEFNPVAELHQVMVKSLTTSFGLDFLLLQDKEGGDVDTVHNVRKGIYATDEEKKAYDDRGDYDSKLYHQDKNYIEKGRQDKKEQINGTLYDSYSGQTMKSNDKRDLDHMISAKEIHDDPGRVLAGLDGVQLANQESNLNSTYESINRSKKAMPADQFVNEFCPKKVENLSRQIEKDTAQLANMPNTTPKQRDQRRKMESKINKNKQDKENFEAVINNKEEFLAADKKARKNYNQSVNTYYSSFKFLKNSGLAAANTGLRMGARQAMGLVLAEIWFELKETLTDIYQQCKQGFDLGDFLQRIKASLKNIWRRVTNRFKDMLAAFKDGAVGGILSSINTTLINIFATTAKQSVRLIRELWNNLIPVIKLLVFNPKGLSGASLVQEVFHILGAGLAVLTGVFINEALNKFMVAIPFGTEISAFLSALITGVLTLGVVYFLYHSPTMKKLWAWLENTLKSQYQKILEEYQAINAELDRHLLELAKIEFNLNTDELKQFSDSLIVANDELARSSILIAEANRRNLNLPFEPDNSDSTRSWLVKC
ncbi:hypothetical protein [Stenoxybacter acetivorans]|uniref:hypothetical protein n=1 Tax=Stenoxybacter acetivorans TaxID=422441 RepID=UPI00056A9530|nr:hypothetical protein [Stenoxybacter acetivorans]